MTNFYTPAQKPHNILSLCGGTHFQTQKNQFLSRACLRTYRLVNLMLVVKQAYLTCAWNSVRNLRSLIMVNCKGQVGAF